MTDQGTDRRGHTISEKSECSFSFFLFKDMEGKQTWGLDKLSTKKAKIQNKAKNQDGKHFRPP